MGDEMGVTRLAGGVASIGLVVVMVACGAPMAPAPPGHIIEIDGYARPSNSKVIRLNGKGIRKLQGIDQMADLETLDLAMNPIRDISQLSALKALRNLDLSSTQVTDIGPLRGLQLEKLVISFSPVADLSPLRGMTSLRDFRAVNTPVSDLAPLSETPNLERLFLLDTRVISLKPLKNLGKLAALSVSGMDQIDYEGLPDSLEKIRLPPAHFERIRSFRATRPTLDVNPADWSPGRAVPWIAHVDLSGKLIKPLPDTYVTSTCKLDGQCEENVFVPRGK